VGYLSAELGPQPPEGYPEGREEFLLAQVRSLVFDKRPWGRAHALELADKNPDKFEQQLGAEIILRSEGDVPSAQKYLELARALRPDSDALVFETSLLKACTEGADRFCQSLEQAVKAHPDSIPLKRTLAVVLIEKEDYAGALALLESLETLDDRWDKLPYYKGMALGGLGRTTEGFALLGDYYAYSNPELALGYFRKALSGTEDAEKKKGLNKEIERISKDIRNAERK
jgi:tetratricopeptide (TPR) repeat protein